MALSFVQLNDGWNADPNVPYEKASVLGDTVALSFDMNYFLFHSFKEHDRGILTFSGCSRWLLGGTNDEGWYMGQCRYSEIAPEWGEFYELVGDDPLRDASDEWVRIGPDTDASRHFLFYLRDSTFECMARDWSFALQK